MDQEPDVIRQQIEQTRESLADKLETLEGQVRQTISSVTSSVEQTVESVKSKVEETVDTVKSKVGATVEAVTSTVGETVDTVKRTFDIPYQVRRHPYLMTGGALAVGAALGSLLASRSRRPRPLPQPEWAPSYAPPQSAVAPAFAPEEPRQAGQGPTSRPGMFSGMLQPLAGEFDKIKAAAIGALLGLARDAAVRWVPPSLVPKVEEIINDVTRRAGGEVVSGPILPRGDEAAGR